MKTYLYVGLTHDQGGRQVASTRVQTDSYDSGILGPYLDLTQYPMLMFDQVTYHHLRRLQGKQSIQGYVSQHATNQAREECSGVLQWNSREGSWEAKMKNGDICIDTTPAEFLQQGYELVLEKDYVAHRVMSQDSWADRYYDEDRLEYYEWCNRQE